MVIQSFKTIPPPKPGNNQAGAGEPGRNSVQRQRVLMQAKALRALPLVDGTLYLALGFLLVPQVSLSEHAIWCLCILLIDCARSALGFRVTRDIAFINVRKVTLTMAVLDGLAGLNFGLGGAYMMLKSPEISVLFILGVAYIVPASGLLVLRASRLGIMLLAIFALTPVVWVWLERHPEHTLIFAGMTLAFWAMIFTASGHLAQVVRQMFNVSRERDTLIASLEKRHREAEDAMASAQEASRMRTQVLGSASHDLRQPMHALSIYAEVLKARHTPEQLASIVSKVDEVIHSLSGLLHRLLDLSRLISNQVSLERETVALDHLIRETCSRHVADATARGIDFRMSLDPVQVLGDASALERVVDNLVENALKFTETGSVSVSLCLLGDGERARLRVEDTGIGISEPDLQHVFEEYFQVRNQARNRRQGVGLGLAIVQRLCNLMNAVITVRSESARGSCFQVDFPLLMPEGEKAGNDKAGNDTAGNDTAGNDTTEKGPRSSGHESSAKTFRASSPVLAGAPLSEGQASFPDTAAWIERSFAQDLMHEFVIARAIALARGPWAQIAGKAGLIAFCLPYVPMHFLLGWASLFVVMACAEALHGSHVLKHIQDKRRLPWFDKVQCLFTFSLGVILAQGWALAATSLPPPEYFLTGTIVLMFPLICVTWVLGSRFSQMAFCIPIILIVGYSTMDRFSEHTGVLAASLVAYFMTIYLAASDLQNMMAEAVQLRRTRERLAHDLAISSQAIDEATRLTAREGRMRTLALASASHDLRQPLHALAMCNATLSMKLSPATLIKVIGNLNNIVRSLGSLLHRLLDLSRSETDGLLIESDDIDLQAVLEDICEQSRPSFESKGLLFQADLAPVSVHADAVAVRRIVGNLLSNAGKFTDTGSVALSSRIIDEGGQKKALIEVIDTGRGVPTAYRSRIFDEYFQIGVAPLVPENGVGLGLAIVQRLCRLMNGDVTYSPVPTGGSSFKVTLPLAFAKASRLEQESDQSVAPGADAKILVIDDDESIAESTLMLLRIWGFDCELAGDGPQADASVSRWGHPDLIIADLRLPGPEQGAQIARRLSAASGHCPVLFITGETSGHAIEDALAGGHTILQKPVEPETLRIHIHKALGASAS